MANFDVLAPKKATNISVNSDLLRQAKELGVNVSALTERSLAAHVRELKTALWQAENAQAIASYNAMIAKDGLWLNPARAKAWSKLSNP